MFNRKCLHKKPLIEVRHDFKGVPAFFDEIWPTQFWFYLDNDFIDTIVAMRVFPYQDRIAFKLLPRGTNKFANLLLRNAELRCLKRIWDCGHKGFNYGIMSYFEHSSEAFQQWVKRGTQNHGCFDWYLDLTQGKRKNG